MKTITEEATISRIKFYLLTICVLNTSSHIKGKPILEIFKNVRGDVTKVTSKLIKIPSGLNFILICKFVLSEKKNMANTYVDWLKIPRNSNSKSTWKGTTDLKNGATLRLDNFSLKDEGRYICVNSKYGFSKSIDLFVTNRSIKNSSTISNSLPLHLNELDRKIIPANITTNIFYTNPQPTKSLLGVQQQKNIVQWRHTKKINLSPPVRYAFACILLAIGCITGVWGVWMKFCYGRGHTWNLTRISNRTQSTQPFNSNLSNQNLNRCGHSSCTRNYFSNPSGACRLQGTPSAPSATIDSSDVSSTIIHENTLRGDLDLPPNYNTFVRNTRVDSEESILPPSYDEALARENCLNNGHTNNHEI